MTTVSDAEKAQIIREPTGFRTVRFWNRETYLGDYEAKLRGDL